MGQNILNFKTSKYYSDLVEELQAIEAIGGASAGKSLVSLSQWLQRINLIMMKIFSLYKMAQSLVNGLRRHKLVAVESNESSSAAYA